MVQIGGVVRIEGIIWLEEIVEKLWRKHRVTEAEVEEVLQNRPRFRFVENGHHPGEDVYAALGRSDAGRLLIVFFVYRKTRAPSSSRPETWLPRNGSDMSRNKSSLSKAHSYEEMGSYWDEHDLGDVWDRTEPAELEVDLKSVKHYYPVDRSLSDRVTRMAREQGISPETLVNLWIQEKVGPPGS